MITPCYHCQDRHQGCHGKCEKYAEYRKLIESAQKEERKDLAMRRWFYQRTTYRVKHLKEIQGKQIFRK